MTTPHDSPSADFEDLEGALTALRERGLRVTAARRLILEGLFAADEPASAERLAGGLDGRLPPSDLASVYRNLETLERAGVVRHLHLGHGPGLYALAGGPRREFAFCERCGEVRQLAADELDDVRAGIRAAIGYEARFAHFGLVGLCPRCARAEAPPAATAN